MTQLPPGSTRTFHTFSLHDALPISEAVLHERVAEVGNRGERTHVRHAIVGRGERRAQFLQRVGAEGRHQQQAAGAEHAAEAGERGGQRSEEHTSELQSLMRISYAVFCLKKKTKGKKE